MLEVPEEASAPAGETKGGTAVTVPKKARSISTAAAAIQSMQRHGEALVQHEASLTAALIAAADAIVTALRPMSRAEQEMVWMRAIGEDLIPNRHEMRNGVAALTAIALGGIKLSAASLSQFRTVVRHVLETGSPALCVDRSGFGSMLGARGRRVHRTRHERALSHARLPRRGDHA